MGNQKDIEHGQTEKKRVAFLGMGAMGVRMATRLVAAGHVLAVYNRSAEPAKALVALGATFFETPRAAVAGADVVIAMVTDDNSSQAVWTGPSGALAGISSNTLCIESSTVTPGWVTTLAEQAAAAGGRFLDAPVAGSRPQAEAGALIYLVGGAADDVADAEPVLLTMGQKVVHAGSVGTGALLKLGVNAMFGVQIAAFGEVIAMLSDNGIAREAAINMLAGMPITSPALAGVAGLMKQETYAPMFPVALVEKDFRYAVETAGDAPVLEAVRARYRQAMHVGLGNENIHAVTKVAALS